MTAREWQPGDVALVNDRTNPDAPWEPATCQEAAVKGQREAVWVLHRSGARVWGSVSQARPLVVIDPEDREQVERLYREFVTTAAVNRADALQAALREFANPTPPKPEEPTGLGAVVKDAEGVRWVRIERGAAEHDGIRLWISERDEDARPLPWSSIAAVRVLSEGVTA